MTCRIEPLSPAAAALLAPLHRAAFPEDPWDGGALSTLLAIPGSFAHIAIVDSAPTGFVLARDLGGECEILSLGVIPEWRRRGFGRALLMAAIDQARRHNMATVVLEVAADNAAAQALYGGLGFTEIGRRRGYYRRSGGSVDALMMSVGLAAFG